MGLGAATDRGAWSVAAADLAPAVAAVEDALRPRWVLWSNDTAINLIRAGVRVATGWDVAAVHRLLFGGWAADPDLAWAAAHGLAVEAIPSLAPPDLFTSLEDGGGDPEDPVRSDGYLRPEWLAGGWRHTPARLRCWAGLAARVATRQLAHLAGVGDGPMASATARCESAAGAALRRDDGGRSADGPDRGGEDRGRFCRSPTER